MRIFIPVFTAALALGCAYNPNRVWSRSEMALAAAAVTCQGVDTVATVHAVNNGSREVNPLYGGHPKAKDMLVVKVPLTAAALAAAHYLPANRKAILIGYGAMSCAVAGYTSYQAWVR